MSRSILLVAYFYPPCRDTGILRSVAMAKWLRRLGHRVTVLTTSAYGELPSDREEPVVRTADAQRWRAKLRGKERIDALFDADTYSGHPHFLSKVVVPEPLRLAWAPFARRRALALNRRERFDCVITTSPPESAHLVGRALQRRRVPWVADVRDAWTFEPLRAAFPTALQRNLDERMERRLLGSADAVVCVSEPAAADLRDRGIADPVLIPNGWDPETEPAGGEPRAGFDPDRVTLLYTGRFGSYGRDPRPLVDAIRELAHARPETAARFELAIAGPLTAAETELFATDLSPARITALGSVPREQAIALQRAADALLLVAQPTRSQLLNIKLFEYLAAGRPVLALAAGTEAGRVVEEIGGESVRADDPVAIARALERLVAGQLAAPSPTSVAPYTYPGPAERMAAVVEDVTRRPA
jgi:glycosyltransferase involved in cell wall biosynthesis